MSGASLDTPAKADAAAPTANAQASSNFSERVFALTAAATAYAEAAAAFPQNADYSYYKAFRGFSSFVRTQQSEQEALLRRIAVCYKEPGATPLDAVDALLEAADHLLDARRGEKASAAAQEQMCFGGGAAAAGSGASAKFQGGVAAGAAARPQDHFSTRPDNSVAPWVAFTMDAAGKRVEAAPGVHPLGSAIDTFEFNASQLSAGAEVVFRPLADTPLVMVDTPAGLDAMAAALVKEPEVAIDLEHHNLYSYLGFTCLMQVSSRTTDYVVDTLRLRDEMWRLAPVFHDPKIVKVLHGATEDVRWLQRDFGLFVVNMFDTALALQTLHMPYSLAFLVDHMCQVRLDKSLQLADWRQRPLPATHVEYARQDTHYLLYCYDRLRAMLLAAEGRAVASGNMLVHVLHESRRLAASRYEKPRFDAATSWREVLGKSLGGLNAAQLHAAQALFNWRDEHARAADTAPMSLLPTGTLMSLACRLPATAAEILRAAHGKVSVEVRRGLKEILALLDAARALLLEDGTMAGPSASSDAAGGASPQAGGSIEGDGFAMPAAQHRPMTGTLPSVAGRAALPSPLDAAAPHKATAATLEEQRRFAAAIGAMRAPSAAALVRVPVPVVVAPAKPSAPVAAPVAAAPSNTPSIFVRSAAVADGQDDDEVAAAAASVAAAASSSAPVTDTSKQQQQQGEDDAAGPGYQSLVDEFGGDGRKFRTATRRQRNDDRSNNTGSGNQ